MTRALVTGADGFIGSHLVEKLLAHDYQVRAFCQYNSFSSFGWLDELSTEKKDSIEFILGDIRDQQSVSNAMNNVDIVFHLAALIAIPYSYSSPQSYVDTNITGTLNVIQAARDHSVSRVIHTSTSETYGSAQFVPISEDHPLVGQSPYAATKIAADQLALSYWRSFNTPITVLRPFNTYGPRQSARAVVPTIITQIASGSRVLKLGSLEPTRDFNFVSDTFEAFCAIAKCDKANGLVVNAASNYEVSIKHTVEVIASIMNADIEIITDDQRLRPDKSEVNRLYGDNTLLKKLTGFKPLYSGIDGFKEGIKITCDWFTDTKNLSRYNANKYNV